MNLKFYTSPVLSFSFRFFLSMPAFSTSYYRKFLILVPFRVSFIYKKKLQREKKKKKERENTFIHISIYTICYFVNKHSNNETKIQDNLQRPSHLPLSLFLYLSLCTLQSIQFITRRILFVCVHAYTCTCGIYTFGNIICIHVSLHSSREIALRDIDCIQSGRPKGAFFFCFSHSTLSPRQFLFLSLCHPLFPCTVKLR